MGRTDMQAPVADPAPVATSEPSLVRRAARGWTPDLALLVALLVLTMLSGRSFAKIELADNVFVTELLMAAIAVAAVWRCGVRGAFERMRDRLPLWLLVGLWIVAAIATLRGLAEYGLSMITHDVGLLEYSLMLPFVAVVVDTRDRAHKLMAALLVGSVATTLFYTVSRFFPEDLDFAANPDPAAWVYFSFVIGYVGVRAAHGLPVRRWLWPVAALALLMTVVYAGRTGLVAVAAGVVVLAIVALPGRRIAATVAGIAAFGVALALAGPVSDGIKSVEVREDGGGETEDEGGGSSGGPLSVIPESFDPNAAGGHNQNASWRLEFWEFMVEDMASQPLLGVGFGHPAEFVFDGALYDGRQDDPNNPFDYTGPHNSFVNLLYRTGVLGLLGVLALIAIAVRRVWAWRDPDSPREERATLAQLVLVLTVTSAIAFFNVALESPQMGLFFWATLALLLVLPKLWTRAPA